MVKRNSRELFFAGFFEDNDSEDNSDHESSVSTHSGYFGGVGFFLDLPVCSMDHYSICGGFAA